MTPNRAVWKVRMQHSLPLDRAILAWFVTPQLHHQQSLVSTWYPCPCGSYQGTARGGCWYGVTQRENFLVAYLKVRAQYTAGDRVPSTPWLHTPQSRSGRYELLLVSSSPGRYNEGPGRSTIAQTRPQVSAAVMSPPSTFFLLLRLPLALVWLASAGSPVAFNFFFFTDKGLGPFALFLRNFL